MHNLRDRPDYYIYHCWGVSAAGLHPLITSRPIHSPADAGPYAAPDWKHCPHDDPPRAGMTQWASIARSHDGGSARVAACPIRPEPPPPPPSLYVAAAAGGGS